MKKYLGVMFFIGIGALSALAQDYPEAHVQRNEKGAQVAKDLTWEVQEGRKIFEVAPGILRAEETDEYLERRILETRAAIEERLNTMESRIEALEIKLESFTSQEEEPDVSKSMATKF